MKSVAEKQYPTEITGLLTLPSPHSTDRPVQLDHGGDGFGPTISSSGNMKDDEEEYNRQQQESRSLKGGKGSQNMKWDGPQSNVGRRRAVFLLLLACIASVSLLALVNFRVRSRQASMTPNYSLPQPFSRKHPVADLGIADVSRPEQTKPPSRMFRRLESPDSGQREPLPTSAWYQNLLLTRGEPSNLHRAYASPYVVDLVGPIPGLTLHSSFVVPTSKVVQLANMAAFGLTLGAAGAISEKIDQKLSHQYTVSSPTELGVTLHWDEMSMASTLVRGMAYGTMIYEEQGVKSSDNGIIFPTIASNIAFGKPPLADGTTEVKCDDKTSRVLVEKEVELYFGDSDFTWLVFFSEPVWVQCSVSKGSNHAFLQVVNVVEGLEPLVIRAAMVDSCTNNRIHNYCKDTMESAQKKGYADLLRSHAAVMPGEKTSMKYQVLEEEKEGTLVLDWNTQPVSSRKSDEPNPALRAKEEKMEIAYFVLPHHMDKLDSSSFPKEQYCVPSIIGPTCVAVGSEMTMTETLPEISFRAKRPIPASFLNAIGDVLTEDLQYELEPFFQRGSGDTYFSGKMLAKLGRIALVAEEVTELCEKRSSREYNVACKNTTIPTKQEMDTVINHLQSSVEIWINGSAETPFIYDDAWGGLVSCGCYFNGTGCDNQVPNCPAFSDQGLNFGNGFYNDQHFHYGYHIYAASIVTHFRPEWGMQYWEQVLLLIRSIANPSREDDAFPLFRHKDWYQGSSWASGVPLPPYLNGKNQESSSEAIAAYEAVALFGKVMQEVWTAEKVPSNAGIAKEVKEVGQLMAATELRSTNKYWHVKQSNPNERIYPVEYTGNVVGIVWQTMFQFGTWFGTAEYLPYGIQLLPLTVISEDRDELAWMNEMYYPFSTSCAEQFQCIESGWGVLHLSVLATVGYREEAAKRVKSFPDDSFTNAAGNGHSRTNTLWYIATRPIVDTPVPLVETDIRGAGEKRPAPVFELTDCHAPSTCTDAILDQEAGPFSCRERITWFIDAQRKSQWEACSAVTKEYPEICGLCDPSKEAENAKNAAEAEDESTSAAKAQCPPCSDDECYSQLNRCPLFDETFVCTAGANAFGCSPQPWEATEDCDACCEMTRCQSLKDNEAKKVTKDGNLLAPPKCPPCPKKICYGELNQCPIHTAPYLCLDGASTGGCASRPWDLSGEICSECCEVTPNC